jgi:hypothetical protein
MTKRAMRKPLPLLEEANPSPIGTQERTHEALLPAMPEPMPQGRSRNRPSPTQHTGGKTQI